MRNIILRRFWEKHKLSNLIIEANMGQMDLIVHSLII